MIAGFLNDPDDINQDIGDGLAVLTLLSQIDSPAVIQTRCGTVLATLVFELSDKTAKPVIAMPMNKGDFGVTAVYATEPGVDLLGTTESMELGCKVKAIRQNRSR
jgi:hypothetical protein